MNERLPKIADKILESSLFLRYFTLYALAFYYYYKAPKTENIITSLF